MTARHAPDEIADRTEEDPGPVPTGGHRRPGRRRPGPLTFVAVAAAAVFVLLGIGAPLLGLKSFSGADLLLLREPWKSTAETGFQPTIPSVSDTIDVVIPSHHYFREELTGGVLADWNPLVSGGSAFGSSPQFAFYTPVNLPYLLFPTSLAPGYSKLLELIVTIGGTVLFLRRLRLSAPAAWVGGVLMASSGFMVSWTNWPQTQTAAFIPVLFWAVERFAQLRTARATLPIAAAVACLLLGGFPAVVGYAIYAAAPYLLMRLAQETGWSPRKALAGAVGAGTGLLLGVGVVAIVLLPLVDQLRQSDYLSERGQTEDVHLPTLMLLTTAVWRAFGTATGDGYWGPISQIEGLSFVGAGALVLIAFGVFRRPHPDVPRGPRTYFAIAAAVTVVLGYVGGPLLHLAQQFPVFSNNPVFRIRSVLGFFLAVLAAYGYDALLRGVRERSRVRAAVEAVGWVLAAVVAAVAVQRLLAVATDVDRVPYVRRQLLWAALPALAMLAVGVVATLTRRRADEDDDRPPRSRLRTAALAVVPLIVVAESLSVVLVFWPRIPKDQFYPTTDAHRFLEQSLGHDRYAAKGLTLFSGTNVYYGLRSATGHSMTELEWKELMLTVDPKSFPSPTFSSFSRLTDARTLQSPLLDVMSVRYFAFGAEDPILGTTVEVGGQGTPTSLAPGKPVTVPIGAGGVRGVAPVLAADARPGDRYAAIDVELLDAGGKVVATGSRRLYTGVRRGPFAIPVAAETAAATSARLTLRSDAPLSLDGSAAGPRLQVTRPDPGDKLDLVFAEGAVIYQREAALPRIRWAETAEVIPDKVRRLTVLANVRDPERVVLDAAGPPAEGRPATVEVTRDEPDVIETRVDAQGAGYLVVGDALQTGWAVTVDGRAADLVPADHAMVAVAVPAGRHDVQLRYTSPGRSTGAVVTVLSLAGMVVMGVGAQGVRAVRRRRRPQPADPAGPAGPMA